jgi:hypothetical protein
LNVLANDQDNDLILVVVGAPQHGTTSFSNRFVTSSAIS